MANCFFFVLSLVAGCANGDFGRVERSYVYPDIHSWLGSDAAQARGKTVIDAPFTDAERLLRDLAFPLIEPPYDRQRWYAILSEYGIRRHFQSDWWYFDRGQYMALLLSRARSSEAAAYQLLIEDIRNDIERIGPMFNAARVVLDLDDKRHRSLAHVSSLVEGEQQAALSRIYENALIVVWVQSALPERVAAYRFALERLVILLPSPLAAEVERLLTLLKIRVDQTRFLRAPVTTAVFPGRAIVSK